MKNFNELKAELLLRARKEKACIPGYAIELSDTMDELMSAIQTYFLLYCDSGLITADLITQYRSEFSAYNIYINEDVADGYVFVDSSHQVVVRGRGAAYACDRCTVYARDNSTVYARDCCTVYAHHNSKVINRDNSTVYTGGNAKVIRR
jgi:hypothetical protein